jgi:hypothetical protein
MKEFMRPADPFATHQCVLQKYIQETSGDIIEFGIGYGSTPLIMDLIKNTNRVLYSLESDKSWVDKIRNEIPESSQHKYVHIIDWEHDIPKLAIDLHSNFSVCFIDSSPWSSRELAMQYFDKKTDYVIVHDVDWFPKNKRFGTVLHGEHNYGFDDVCKHSKTYFPPTPWPAPTGPPTLVYSHAQKQLFDIAN